MKETKTNVMRLLDLSKICYEAYFYPTADGKIDGVSVADKMGQDPATVYKTLVAACPDGQCAVFVIPVQAALNLKKAAKAVGAKSVSMIPQKELLPKTGYVHGGCSPIGLKKPFPITIDQSVKNLPFVICSGGKVGAQVKLAPADLQSITNATFADITD